MTEMHARIKAGAYNGRHDGFHYFAARHDGDPADKWCVYRRVGVGIYQCVAQ